MTRSNTLFIVLNIIISLAISAGVIFLYTNFQTPEEPRARPTIVLVVSATPDPNQPLPAEALQATLDSQSGTVVALERQLNSANNIILELQNPSPAAVTEQNDDNSAVAQAPPPTAAQPDRNLPTIDPRLIPQLPTQVILGSGGAEESSSLAVDDNGCQRYTVQSGDTASTIAARLEVSLSQLFVLNGINDRTILQIGDQLLVPSPDCQQEIPPTITPTPQPTFNLTIVAPTATLVPVVAPRDAQIQLAQVLNAGDITTEQVEIQNRGGEINLQNWTLEDENENVFTFPAVRLVPGSVVRISSRTGTNTPGFLYWNQNTPVWSNGEVATLRNAEGEVQSILTVGSQVIEFGPSPTP